MKKTARIIALILSTVFIMTACGGPTVELLDFLGADLSSVDYGGYEFQFYFQNDVAYDEDKMIYVYDKNTVQGDALLKRFSYIKDTINVDITLNQKYGIDDFRTIIMSGGISADACQLDMFNAMYGYAKTGLLYPITDFSDYIDLSQSEKYGSANVLEPGMVDSVPYVITPVSWYGFEPLDSHILTYNTDLFDKYGLTNFHEFYENETWTWETFENEFLKKANAETSEGILPALSTDHRSFFDIMMYSNGTEFIVKDENGDTKSSLAPEAMVKAYNQGLEWVEKYPDNIDLLGGLFVTDDFCKEETLSTLALAAQLTTGNIAYNQFGHSFNYNIAPFPAGPDAEYGVWAQYIQRTSGWGICKTSNDPTVAAHTISLLFEPFEELGGKSGLYDFHNSNTFLSELDTEIYFELMKHVRYNYTFSEDSSHDIGRDIAEFFGTGIKNGKSFTEIFEKYQNRLDELVNEYMLPNFDYMYENYYYQFDN